MATTFLVPENNAVSKLAAFLAAGGLSLTLATGDGSLFPSTFPFHVTIDAEIIKVGARSSDVLSTLTRAQEGTAAADHAAEAVTELRVTAQAVSDLNTAVNELERRTRSVVDISFGDSPLGESFAP
jgi:hypothetical protein